MENKGSVVWKMTAGEVGEITGCKVDEMKGGE